MCVSIGTMPRTVHPRVCVSGISSWNSGIADDLALYSDLGVHTIGAALRKLDSNADVGLLAASGLRVANVIGVGPFRLDEPTTWSRAQAYVRDALLLAERLGAPHLVLTTGQAGALEWDAAADALATAVGSMMGDGPVRICIENTNSLRVDVGFVHTLRDAIDVARRLDVLVCMEVNACWAERDLANTIVDGIERIGVVQVSDFAIGTLSTPNRLVPGDGDIPLRRIVGQLLDAGYAGVFDLELVGPRIEDEGYTSAIARSVTWLTDLLDSLGA
jgi:sugar phosphate isomerase/epimerase